MSRDDWEDGKKLYSPFVEIGKGREPQSRAPVNASTFKPCLGHLRPVASPERGPLTPEKPFYSVYGVIGRTVISAGGGSYLNISEPPLSRTLMGYILEEIVKEKLPRVHKILSAAEE